MNKQNKLILRVFKAALKVAEAAKKIEDSKLENKYGTSMRPQNNIPSYHGCPKPTTGKTPLAEVIARLHQANTKLREEKQEWSSQLQRKVAENARLRLEIRALKIGCPTLIHDFRENPLINSEGLNKTIEQIGKEIILDGVWKNAKGVSEKSIEDFAGDDRSHVYSLIEKHLGINRTDSVLGNGRAFVHLKSPELGTETLVVLSPEGETLLKIVKDNSRKFEVK